MKKFGVEFDRMNGQAEFWGERGVDFDQHGLYPFLFTEVVAAQVARNLIRYQQIYAPARVVNMDTNEVVLVVEEA